MYDISNFTMAGMTLCSRKLRKCSAFRRNTYAKKISYRGFWMFIG